MARPLSEIQNDILRIFHSLEASTSRHCAFYKAVNGKWYMDLAEDEYGQQEEAITYGPFGSFEAAMSFLDKYFSNPGGFFTDDKGTKPVPTRSPNGSPVQNPSKIKDRWNQGIQW